jgi:hypothetical protein
LADLRKKKKAKKKEKRKSPSTVKERFSTPSFGQKKIGQE